MGGGFHGISSVGVVYFVLVVRPWSFYPRAPMPYLVCVCLRGWAYHSCSFFALGSAVCVFGGIGVLSGGVWLPSLSFAGVPFIPSLLSAWAAHWVCPHTILIPFRGVGGLLFFVCSLAVSTFSSAVAAYRVCMFGKEERVAVSLVAGRVGVACVSIRGGPCSVHSYLLLFAAAYMCAGIPLALLVPPGACGTPSSCVWFPPFGYIRVSLIPCFIPPCEQPRV